MELEKFIKLVQGMRDEQKKFFKTRDSVALMNARNAEHKVDQAIQEFYNPKLFQS